MTMKNISQTKASKEIVTISKGINRRTIKDIAFNIRKEIYKKIRLLDLDKEVEKNIRWRRTADEILKDGFVDKKRGCTDIVILFLALAKAKGINCKFLKLQSKDKKFIHSVVRIRIGKEDYLFDITNNIFEKEKNSKILKMFNIIAAGNDSWDIGLKSYDDKSNFSII